MPAAAGTPTPTYAAVGSLPAGLSFASGNRRISGTPQAAGSGTIRIRATNSQGTDDWTVTYTTTAALTPPGTPTDLQVGTRTSTTIALSVSPGSGGTPTRYRWRLSTNNVMSNSDTVRNTTGSTVTFTGLNAGTSYWVDVRAENSGGNSGYNPSGNTGLMTSTLAAPPLLTAPSFSDDTGNAQTWTVGTAITSITVPTASGNPTPSYAVQGSLPSGIAFNTTTRVISGTPTAVGGGTIRIRATNSQGSDDWTVAYTTSAGLTAPSFTDSTGDAQTWTQDETIASITVPTASGNPTPSYAVQGSLPSGIAFNTSTRVISGTPTTVGSGTITIRATNSAGNADWTVTYTTSAALVAPSFTDNTGPAQSWTAGTTSITASLFLWQTVTQRRPTALFGDSVQYDHEAY